MPRSVIVSIRYAVETSPTVKNLAQLLHASGHEVVIVIDMFYRNVQFQPDYAEVVSLKDSLPLNALRLMNRLPFGKAALGKYFMRRELKRQLQGADHLFLVEAFSLGALMDVGVDVSRAAFMFLENTQMLSIVAQTQPRVQEEVLKCAVHIIQSKERGADVNRALNASLSFSYLPVSLRPLSALPSPNGDTLKVVFSGYFAPWSQVLETIDLAHALRTKLSLTLTMRGHIVGDSDYLDQVKQKMDALNVHDIATLDTSYLSDADHLPFLASHHVGVAFYGPAESDNWENLIFSSGKIATYLWAGLPVLTDVDDALTYDWPFINIKQHSLETITAMLREVVAHPETYRAKARAMAEQYYNFDAHAHSMLLRMGIDTDKSSL